MRRFINTAVILTLLWSDIVLRVVAVLVLCIFGHGGLNAVFFGLGIIANFISKRGPGWAASYAVWRVKVAKARADKEDEKLARMGLL